MFYMVEVLMNGRQGTGPSKFESKDDAIWYATKVKAMEDDDVKIENHMYEVTEITY